MQLNNNAGAGPRFPRAAWGAQGWRQAALGAEAGGRRQIRRRLSCGPSPSGWAGERTAEEGGVDTDGGSGVDLPLRAPGEVWFAAGQPDGLAGAPAPGPSWSPAPPGLQLGFLRLPGFSSWAATAPNAANPEAPAPGGGRAPTADHVARGDAPRRAGRAGRGGGLLQSSDRSRVCRELGEAGRNDVVTLRLCKFSILLDR